MGSAEIQKMTGDIDFDELLDKCIRVLKTKGLDYATADDRLAELRATAEAVNTDMRTVLGVYMNKHFRSIFKWFRSEELRGEPIEEKLVDNIVYSLIAYKLVREEREAASSHVDKPSVCAVCLVCGCKFMYDGENVLCPKCQSPYPRPDSA